MRKPWFLFTCLVFGYAFLYVPIILLMIYSFNASRLVTIWGGFSFKWYGTLLDNEQMMDGTLDLATRLAHSEDLVHDWDNKLSVLFPLSYPDASSEKASDSFLVFISPAMHLWHCFQWTVMEGVVWYIVTKRYCSS